MCNYSKLIQVLSQQELTADPAVNSKLKAIICNKSIFDVLVWSLNVKNIDFRQISSTFGYNNISACNFKSFLYAIKPCFQDYFIDYFSSYFQFLVESENDKDLGNCRFQSFIPIKLKQDEYFFVNLYVIPEIVDKEIVELYFVLTPLKEYQDESISFRILRNCEKDELITRLVKSQVAAENPLTKEQSEVFTLLLRGYSSNKIAEILNKKKENVFKYNIRINERLTAFFNIDFDTVREATDYYKNCFLST